MRLNFSITLCIIVWLLRIAKNVFASDDEVGLNKLSIANIPDPLPKTPRSDEVVGGIIIDAERYVFGNINARTTDSILTINTFRIISNLDDHKILPILNKSISSKSVFIDNSDSSLPGRTPYFFKSPIRLRSVFQ